CGRPERCLATTPCSSVGRELSEGEDKQGFPAHPELTLHCGNEERSVDEICHGRSKRCAFNSHTRNQGEIENYGDRESDKGKYSIVFRLLASDKICARNLRQGKSHSARENPPNHRNAGAETRAKNHREQNRNENRQSATGEAGKQEYL